MNHQHPHDDDSPDLTWVDQAVRDALQVQPDEVTLARLERFWKIKSQRASKPTWRFAVAAAAAVLLAVTVGWQIVRPTDLGEIVASDPANSTREGTLELTSPNQPPPNAPVASRPPTAMEVVAFYAQTSRRPRVAFANPSEKPSAEQQVAALLAQAGEIRLSDWLAIKPETLHYEYLLNHQNRANAARLLVESLGVATQSNLALDALSAAPAPPVDAMFALLEDKDPLIRQNAALALGTRNGPEISQRLIAIVTDRDTRRPEAWLALANCRGTLAQSFLAQAAQQPRLLGYLNAARVRWSLPL